MEVDEKKAPTIFAIWRDNRQKVLHADIRCGIGRMELTVKVVVDLIREKLIRRNTK